MVARRCEAPSARIVTGFGTWLLPSRPSAGVLYAFTMPRPKKLSPRERVPGWPETPTEDAVAEVARRFAMNLRAELQGLSLREAASRCGVDHTTIFSILDGRSWPELETIAKLELGMGVSLWPVHDGTTEVKAT